MDYTASPTGREAIKDFDYKIIVAGSRNYSDYYEFKQFMDYYISTLGDKSFIFISGAAKSGADRLIIEYCKRFRLPWSEFPADWDTGKGAGYIRNAEMLKYANGLVVFWDGRSNGTKHMMTIAEKKKIPIKRILIDVD
jgi:hypothetical protein